MPSETKIGTPSETPPLATMTERHVRVVANAEWDAGRSNETVWREIRAVIESLSEHRTSLCDTRTEVKVPREEIEKVQNFSKNAATGAPPEFFDYIADTLYRWLTPPPTPNHGEEK